MRKRLTKRLMMIVPLALLLARSAPACPPAKMQMLHLPHLRAALSAHRPVVIAALGSSSTEGAMASDPGDSYPAALQHDLSALLPQDEISVINRGIGGEDAAREDARMARDVLALRPQLVIWQVGANAAMWGESPAQFGRLVEAGLARLRDSDADILLMDNQRSRRLLASRANGPINAALARLARRHRIGLFSRDALMREWAAADTPPAAMLAPDGLHMNDAGYACLAETLSRSIDAAVKP